MAIHIIGGATPCPGWKRHAPAQGRLVPRLEKYGYFNIMSRLPQCAPYRDHRAPAVPRLVPKAGAATAGGQSSVYAVDIKSKTLILSIIRALESMATSFKAKERPL